MRKSGGPYAFLKPGAGCFLSAVVPASAEEQDCSALFYGGQAPVLTNPKLSAKTQQLCFSEFTILHSGLSRRPLWSAEDLTREHLAVAVSLRRPASNAFHEEASLQPNERSSLDDYRLSGFDAAILTIRQGVSASYCRGMLG